MGLEHPLWWFWTRVHYWSLDVALGAVVMCLWLGEQVGVSPDPVDLGCLCLAVWSIYLADRLYDSYTMPYEPDNLRRNYYLKHRPWLWVALLVGLLSCFTLAMGWMRLDTWLSATLALFVVVGYYLMVIISRLFGMEFYSKEMLVALGYAVGLGVPIAAQLPNAFPAPLVLPSLVLGLLAWLNLNTIAWFEAAYVQNEPVATVAKWLGLAGLKRLMWTLWLICLGLCWSLAFWRLMAWPHAIGITIVLTLLAGIWVSHPFLAKNGLFRLSTEALFILPLGWLNI